jgi:hypothetical protein
LRYLHPEGPRRRAHSSQVAVRCKTAAMTVSPSHRSPNTLRLQVDGETPKARASWLPEPAGRADRHASTNACCTLAISAQMRSPPGGTRNCAWVSRPKPCGLVRYSRGVSFRRRSTWLPPGLITALEVPVRRRPAFDHPCHSVRSSAVVVAQQRLGKIVGLDLLASRKGCDLRRPAESQRPTERNSTCPTASRPSGPASRR